MTFDWLPSFFAAWNWVDWLFAAILLYGLVSGAWRGLSHELAVLLSYAFAVVATRMAYAPLSEFLGRILPWSGDYLRLTAIFLTLLVAVLVLWGVRMALGVVMSFAFKGWLERVGGALAGTFRWGLLAILLLHIASLLPWSPLQRAILYDSSVVRVLIPNVEQKYNEIAEKASLPPISNPTGVRLPSDDAFYMPPLVGDTAADNGPFE